jgi:5S rRNA maturation endonuclease (ribonuclease M5)
MLNTVQDFVKTILPTKKKTSPSGWTSFNAVCCEHNGETPDRRGRGGIANNQDGSVSYHCFNCNFKASYQPGRHLTYKFRKLMSWFGADPNEVQRLVIEAIRIRELVSPEEVKLEEERVEFTALPLPKDSVRFKDLEQAHPALEYVYDRKIDIQEYDFYVTEDRANNMHKRVIVPCYWHKKLIGYIGRAVDPDVKPKYWNKFDTGYVFNVDRQLADWKFVIVCEGPFDAMSVDGVAVMSNQISEQQADIIDSLGREVIVVADRDQAGSKLLKDAQEYGWTASFPVWQETCKDINEAVQQYGKLFVLKSIIDSKETSKLKIELMRKKLYADR